MFIFIIIAVVTFSTMAAILVNSDERKFKDKSNDLSNIGKTEMMSNMYKDITGNNLDPIEKSILFGHNSKKNK